MRRLLIVGAGGHGRALADAIVAGGCDTVAGFVDDAGVTLQRIHDWPIFGTLADILQCRQYADAIVVAIGNNVVRARAHSAVRAAGFPLATVIHPEAVVSPRARLGEGTVVMACAVVGTDARLGEGVIVNCGAIVDHDCRVGDFAHLSVRAAMSGGTSLGRLAWMQAGSVLAYGVDVPDEEVVTPGKAVCKD